MKIKEYLYTFPTGLLWRINGFVSTRLRKKKFNQFMNLFAPTKITSILDVGPYGGKEFDNYTPVNYLERWYPYKNKITALSIEDVSRLQKAFPEVNVVMYEGGTFPFSKKEFDIAFSNAVVEHVGNRDAQKEFILEMLRVAKSVYITTPNRWFFLEAHTLIPFIHWLPSNVYRGMLKKLGLKYWAEEKNLNLLSPWSISLLLGREKGIKIWWRPWNPNIVIIK